MKATNFKTLSAIVIAALLFAATSISLPPNSSAFAFDPKKQGQDHAGKNCERIDSKESSTFGKCESVCKDKEIVKKDVENNRYVCHATKTKVGTQTGTTAPKGGAKVEPVPASGIKRPKDQAVPKITKAKKG